VQRLVDDDWVVDADEAPRTELALHHGVHLVGAAVLRVFLAGLGEFEQAVAVDRAQVGFDGFGHGVLLWEVGSAEFGRELPLAGARAENGAVWERSRPGGAGSGQ